MLEEIPSTMNEQKAHTHTYLLTNLLRNLNYIPRPSYRGKLCFALILHSLAIYTLYMIKR